MLNGGPHDASMFLADVDGVKTLELDSARPTVAVESGDPLVPEDPTNPEHALLRELAAELGAELSWEAGTAPGRIALSLPG